MQKWKKEYPYLECGWVILALTGLAHTGQFLVYKLSERRGTLPAVQLYTFAQAFMAIPLFAYSLTPWEDSLPNCKKICAMLTDCEAQVFQLSLGLGQLLCVLSFIYLGTGDAMAILVTSGPVAVILAVILFGENLNLVECASIVLCILGVICIVRPPVLFHPLFGDVIDTSNSNTVSNWGYAISAASTLGMGIATALNGDVARKHSTSVQNWLSIVYHVIPSVIYMWITQDYVWPLNTEHICWIIGGTITCTLSRVGWSMAGSMIPVAHQSIILSFDKVWAYFAGVMLFNEQLHLLSIVGAAEVWIAVVLMAVQKDHKVAQDLAETEDKPLEKTTYQTV